ncbi:MAG TPA: hypothetical protein VFY10_07375, partial [Dehalococcoidia bacterium]|nr:hypothetical protein [Dehalococcoidia bacterium]
EVLCYVDHLGAFLSGRNTSKGMSSDGKTFIDRYMRQVDQGYANGDLLYEMYRHGTVHNFEPIKVKKAGRIYKWFMFDGGRSTELKKHPFGLAQVMHLSPAPDPFKAAEVWLPVSTECLVLDLVESINLLRRDILSTPEMLGNWNRHAAFLCKPKCLT